MRWRVVGWAVLSADGLGWCGVGRECVRGWPASTALLPPNGCRSSGVPDDGRMAAVLQECKRAGKPKKNTMERKVVVKTLMARNV